MAYNTEELKKQSLSAIEKHKIFFIEDIIAYITCSKETFYNHKLHESVDIKEALFKNRVEVKSAMRNKWYKSDNATLQVALYKLIGTEKEAERLGMNVKHTGDNDNPIYHSMTVNVIKSDTPLGE